MLHISHMVSIQILTFAFQKPSFDSQLFWVNTNEIEEQMVRFHIAHKFWHVPQAVVDKILQVGKTLDWSPNMYIQFLTQQYPIQK